MEIDKKQIIEALEKVKDPATGQDIIAMRRVRNLIVEGKSIQFSVEVPSGDATTKSSLNFACIQAVNEAFPDAQVHIHMISGTPAASKQEATSHIKHIIAVASGKGGVGKSTVSTNLAIALKQKGLKVGLIDADLYGPSIPTMLGLQGQRPKVQDVHGKARIVPLDFNGMPVMSIGFIIEPEQAVVLRGPRLGAIIKQFFQDTIWPELDVMIVDLPPGTGDIQLTLVQTVSVTGAVIVTTPQDVAVADAIKAMNMFLLPSVNVPILGVVENMSWFTPAELPDHKYFIFGEGGGKTIAQKSNSVLLGQIPLVQGIREAGDSGLPVSMQYDAPGKEAFKDIATKMLEQLSLRLQMKAPTETVKIKHD